MITKEMSTKLENCMTPTAKIVVLGRKSYGENELLPNSNFSTCVPVLLSKSTVYLCTTNNF